MELDLDTPNMKSQRQATVERLTVLPTGKVRCLNAYLRVGLAATEARKSNRITVVLPDLT